MKKTIALIFAVSLFLAACKGAPPPPDMENPGVGPALRVTIPDLFSPDPDIADDTMTIAIAVVHPVPIKEWHIQIQPQRGGHGTGGQRQAGEARPAGEERQEGRRRRAFFEQRGTGTVPEAWKWNGKGTSGEMVQSAMDYRFTLSVTDVFDNNSEYQGIIGVDVLVRREGDILRIIVPSIVFPPNSSDFSLLSEDDRRSNTRIMTLIARALNRFGDYAITIEGHANPTTRPNTANRRTEEATELKPLSEARAKAVLDSLADNNHISRSRLSSVGIGGERTVAAYDNDDENWKNRRVEFILRR